MTPSAGGGFGVGSIWGKMLLDTSQWDKALKKIITTQLGQLKNALNRVTSSIRQLGTSFAVAGAAAAASSGLMLRSFIKASDTAEQLRFRLDTVLRSAEAGAGAFKDMATLAGRVPQEFKDVLTSAADLAAGLQFNREELAKWMPVITDIQALFGMTMREATGNFIRMFNSGAKAADLFRDRGVLAMLDFENKVQYTADETRRMAWEAFIKVDSQFRGAAKRLATTFTGLLSMLKDRWFMFRYEVMKTTGAYDQLKRAMSALWRAIMENWDIFFRWVELHRTLIKLVFLSTAGFMAMGIALIALGITLRVVAFGLGTINALLVKPLLIGAAIIAGFYAFRAIWTKTRIMVGDDIMTVGNAVGKFWGDLRHEMRKAFAEFIDLWNATFGKLGKEEALKAINTIVAVIRAAFAAVGTFIGQWANLIVNFYSRIIEAIKRLILIFKMAAKAISLIIDKDFKGAWEVCTSEMAPALDAALKASAFAAKETGRDVWGVLTEGWIAGTKEFKKAMDEPFIETMTLKLPLAVKAMWNDIKIQFREDSETLKALIAEYFPWLEGLLADFLKFYEKGMDDLSLQTTKEVEDLRSLWRKYFDTLHEWFVAGLRAWGAEFVSWDDFMRGKIKGVLTTVEGSIADALESFTDGTKSAKEALKDFCTDVLKSMNRLLAEMTAKRIMFALFGQEPFGKKDERTRGLLGALGSGLIGAIGGGIGSLFGAKPTGIDLSHPALNVGLSDITHPALGGTSFYDLEHVSHPAFGQKGLGEMAVTVINVLDPSTIAQGMATPEGENVILNVISRDIDRSGTTRQLIKRRT